MSDQNTQIQSGEIKDLQENYKFGWFMGKFVDDKTPFHSEDFEIKLGFHPKGEERESTADNANDQKTLGILIKGKFKVKFHESDDEILIDKPYQYMFWSPALAHTSIALEDTEMLTIRWPSL